MRTLRGLAGLILTGALACAGGGDPVGPAPDSGERILAVGVARNDLSPVDPLEGFLVFFYDMDSETLLEARVAVNQNPIAIVVEPGIVEGPVYVGGGSVEPGSEYRMTATVATSPDSLEVSSGMVSPPAAVTLDVPDVHEIGEPLTVRWSGVEGATGVNVAAGSGYEVDLPASATSTTIPAVAFDGLEPGATIEIEVTAYDTFYVSLSAGISGLQDAESFAARFEGVDNVEGAEGAFGAATTVGAIVTLE